MTTSTLPPTITTPPFIQLHPFDQRRFATKLMRQMLDVLKTPEGQADFEAWKQNYEAAKAPKP